MKAKVKKNLNERGGKPSVNATNDSYYKVGNIIDIVDIVNGDLIDNNSLWFKLDNGKYVWSGGVAGMVDVEPKQINENLKTSINIRNLEIYKSLPDEIKNAHGKGITIAVLDSGICKTHPALKNQIIKSENYTPGKKDISNSHGTRVAGIIAGNSDEFKGFAPEAQLIDYRVINNDNSVNQGKLVNTLNDIYSKINNEELTVHIINMSLDADASSISDIIEIVNKLTSIGVIIVVAAGDPESPNFVSKLNKVIRVGIKKTGNTNIFEILFENKEINSTGIPKDGKMYETIKDSSAYTAVVSGIIAKYISNNNISKESIIQNTINFIKQLTN